jgi:hypothetical protein
VFIKSPSLALAAAYVASVIRRPHVEVERYIRFGETEREPDGPLPMGAHSVSSAVALLRAGWPHDNVGVALKASEAAAAEETDPSRGTYILARCSLGQALFLSGRAEEAIAQLTDVLNAPLAPVQPLLRIVARAILAAVWVDRGDPARAMELARRAMKEATEARLPLVPLLWWVPVALSRVLVQVGQLDEAERVLSAELDSGCPSFALLRAVMLPGNGTSAVRPWASAGRLVPPGGSAGASGRVRRSGHIANVADGDRAHRSPATAGTISNAQN